MRLRRLRLDRYRSFIDQTLLLDRQVTVMVGRNDTGKTSILHRFFDQYVFEGVIHSADVPRVTGAAGPIQFSLTWEVADNDYDQFPLLEAFGKRGVRTLEMRFRNEEGPSELWTYVGDGQRLSAYQGKAEDGTPIRRDVFRARNLLPRPQYLHVDRTVMTNFQARLFDLPAATPANSRPLAGAHEASLLRLAGLAGETRPVSDERWPPTPFPQSTMSLAEVEDRLEQLSTRMTKLVRRWWDDPPGVTVNLKLAGNDETKPQSHRENNLYIICNLTDATGLPLLGSGFLWFFTFLLNLELLGEWSTPLLLLIDEPATPLHPSAQRRTAKLLDELARKHQVIYSTHSPFLIDWNFPQRIRVFERDPVSRRSLINNRPYVAQEQIWDPLRESIGVTLGDIGGFAEVTILVEGITDQIILANASRVLEITGGPNLDLAKTSILPYGDERALEAILVMGKRAGVRCVVITDFDEQGRKTEAVTARLRANHVSIGNVLADSRSDLSIEDLLGVEGCVTWVNETYSSFDWFRPISAAEVTATRGTLSLGRALEVLFANRFGKNFSKVSVAVTIADAWWHGSATIPYHITNLIGQIIQAAG